jgi:hypothetical protein
MQNAECKMRNAKVWLGLTFHSCTLHFAFSISRMAGWAVLLSCWLLAGCGTTKWTDTTRTATEQLLITDSMDRAVSRLDFRAVAGKKIFVDDTPVKGMTDANYLVSTVKQELLASGGILKEPKDQADYVLEIRAGALGTDRHDVLLGVPATTIPTLAVAPGIPNQIPEIPFVKKTNQRAVTKIALFLYNRQTGRPVWQSGVVPEESRATAWWVLGTGPFQQGSIYSGTKFVPLADLTRNPDGTNGGAVNDPAFFVEPKEEQKATVANNNKDGANTPKDQAIAGPAGPAAPKAAAAANAQPPGSGPRPAAAQEPPGAGAPSGSGSPAVVPASHTTLDKPPPSVPSAGPRSFGPPAAWAPQAPLPPGDARDRVFPLPPVSPFDE